MKPCGWTVVVFLASCQASAPLAARDETVSSTGTPGSSVSSNAASRATERPPLNPTPPAYTLSYVQRRGEVQLWCTSVSASTLDEFKRRLGVQHPAATRDAVVAVVLEQNRRVPNEERVAVEHCPTRRVLAECHGDDLVLVYEPSVLEQRRTVCLLNNSDWRYAAD
jgi:hypothetical protein